MNRCPDCGLVLPLAHERRGCPYQRLRAELIKAVVPWTGHDERMARWLAGWDEPTVEWVLSLVRRGIAAPTVSSITRLRGAPAAELVCSFCGASGHLAFDCDRNPGRGP